MAKEHAAEEDLVMLRHHDGLGIDEISRALGVQPNAAKHSIFRALKKLRRVLEPALSSAKGVA